MYPCVSPRRCMCNVSTWHAQGPSQWVPMFSQAIPFPQSSHYANIRHCTCSLWVSVSVLLYPLMSQHGFHIDIIRTVNSEPCNGTLNKHHNVWQH